MLYLEEVLIQNRYEKGRESMECLYRTTTKFTLEEYKKFNRAVFLRKKKILLIILAELLILVGGILSQEKYLIIFAILYPFILVWMMNCSVKRVFNSNKVTQNTDVTFEFYEDHFEQKHESGNAKIQYSQLDEIIETKTNFYLMIAKNQGYMLLKANMPEGLEEFLLKLKSAHAQEGRP